MEAPGDRSGLVQADGAWRLLLDGVDGLAVAGGVVYVATPAGLYALDADSGQEVWHADLFSEGRVQLAVDDDVLGYWEVWEDDPKAVSVETGEVLAQVPSAPPPDAGDEPTTVTVDGTVLELAGEPDAVTATDPAGEVAWRVALADGPPEAGPVATGAWVLVSTFETLYALDATHGTVRWSIDGIVSSFDPGPMVVEDGWVYAGLSDGSVLGVDLSTSEPPAGLEEVRAWRPPNPDAGLLDEHRAWLEQLARDRPFTMPPEIADLPLPADAVVATLASSERPWRRDAEIVLRSEDNAYDEVVAWFTQALPDAGYAVTDSAPDEVDQELFGDRWRLEFDGPGGRRGELFVSAQHEALAAAYPWINVRVVVGQPGTATPGAR